MSTSNKIMKSVSGRLGIILVVLVSVILGFIIHAALRPQRPITPSDESENVVTKWTCSMHPQIRSDKPGRCPQCSMALIPVAADLLQEGIREFSTSAAAKALMDIETSPVQRKFVKVDVPMVGKVDFDETKLAYITAWVPGRLDRLYVDYTGVTVNKGDHMLYIYSPELITAQQELLQAKQAVEASRSGSEIVRKMNESTLAAARGKLRLLGLTEGQIEKIEQSKETSEHLTLYSPVSGIVIHKNATEGMYVKTGTRIYTIADLSQMWVQLDAYESDLMWLRYGQEVELTTISNPGKIFKGTISFIDPVLDTASRTVKVRVNVPNPDELLKPGMFVKATVHSHIAAEGKVMAPDLSGKWICPMHPEIVKDEKGKCDTCEMPLVTPESLGYVSYDPAVTQKPLVIPATAPLVTGKRAIVYVELPDREKPTYEGREVILGPRAGDYYIVKSGLTEGQRVVTRGNFKIDSALQILAKPSMMSPEGGQSKTANKTIVNSKCPIMGMQLDQNNVPDQLVRVWKGKRIGFCCQGCPDAWDKLSDSQKHEKLMPDMKPTTQSDTQVWTCSMHPEIRSDKPGRCPKCNMDLVLQNAGQEGRVHE